MKKSEIPKTRTSITLDKDNKRILDELAVKERRSIAFLINEILDEVFNSRGLKDENKAPI